MIDSIYLKDLSELFIDSLMGVIAFPSSKENIPGLMLLEESMKMIAFAYLFS